MTEPPTPPSGWPTAFRLRRRTLDEANAYLTDQLLRAGAEKAAMARVIDHLTHPFEPNSAPRPYCTHEDCYEGADDPVHTTMDVIRRELRERQ